MALASGGLGQAELVGADLGRRPIAVTLDDPGPVVDVLELVKGQAQFFDGVEAADPEQVLLQRPDEALGAAVAFGLAHEGGRARDAEEGEFALEVVGDVLAAVIVAKLEASCDASSEGTEAGANTLPDRLEGLEPGAWLPATTTEVVAERRPRRAAWMPRHSVEQWSTVTKIEAWPSPVRADVRSVPHIASTRAVLIVPSWALGPCGRPTRPGACSPCSRVRRRTRRLEVRMPVKRSRAQIFR